MATLTIAGTALNVAAFRRLQDETGGGPRRTLSGRRRGDCLWVARGWEAEVVCLTDADADALHTLCDNVTDRTCAGDALPAGGVVCQVEVTDDQYEAVKNTWCRVLSLRLHEAL